MYIQITTRCNMECPHCCFSCTEEGIDMTLDTFIEACKLAEKFEEPITLGGGEPTIHPNFMEMLGISIVYSTITDPFLVTNGKKTDTAIKLHYLTENEKIYCILSQDLYHESIDEKVVKLFREKKRIRNVDERVLPYGRGKDFGYVDEGDCVCNCLFVDPLGDIYSCGCKEIYYGNVHNKEVTYDIIQKNYVFEESCPKENGYSIKLKKGA